MWFKNLFTPKTKLTPATHSATPQERPTDNELERIITTLDVDLALRNPAYKRLLINTYTLDIAQLLGSVHTGAKTSSSKTAVSLYDYFRATQLPPSVCIDRLISALCDNNATVTVRRDIEAVVAAFDEIAFLMNERDMK